MKSKFFTIVNNEIGTAHLNRAGELADFRKAKLEIDCFHLILVPAKRVLCEPLKIRLTSKNCICGDLADWEPRFQNYLPAVGAIIEIDNKSIKVDFDDRAKWFGLFASDEADKKYKEWQNQQDILRKEQKEKRDAEDAVKQIKNEKMALNFPKVLENAFDEMSKQERRWLSRWMLYNNAQQEARQTLEKKLPAEYDKLLSSQFTTWGFPWRYNTSEFREYAKHHLM